MNVIESVAQNEVVNEVYQLIYNQHQPVVMVIAIQVSIIISLYPNIQECYIAYVTFIHILGYER